MNQAEAPARPAQELEPAQCVVVALWFGLATGLAEVAVLGFRRGFGDAFTFTNPHALWFDPPAPRALTGSKGPRDTISP